MKKLYRVFTLTIAVLLTQPATAQTVFAPVGAEWWYRVAAVGGPYLRRVWVTGDTVLAGHAGTWQQLRHQYFWYAGNNSFYPGATQWFEATQCRGDRVWVTAGTGEQLLLDFATAPGAVDTLDLCPFSPAGISGTVQLDSVGTRAWAGGVRRVQWWSRSTSNPYDDLWQFSGGATERLGYPYAVIIPQVSCGTDPDFPELTYYYDNGGSFGTRPTIVTGLLESAVTRALQVAPNPSASGRFRVAGLTEAAVPYAVYDAQGRRVGAGTLTGALPEVNLSELSTGLYLLRGAVNGQAFTRRLVRQ